MNTFYRALKLHILFWLDSLYLQAKSNINHSLIHTTRQNPDDYLNGLIALVLIPQDSVSAHTVTSHLTAASALLPLYGNC